MIIGSKDSEALQGQVDGLIDSLAEFINENSALEKEIENYIRK